MWEGWDGWVMDIGEGYGECCELCKTDESQTCTPETNNTVYVKKEKKEQCKTYTKIVVGASATGLRDVYTCCPLILTRVQRPFDGRKKKFFTK